jgi:ABC-type Na+ efflux pump permease subunit
VHIRTQENALYPAAKPQGQPLLNTLVIVIVTVTIGMSLVSLLIIEEKESHTFEALMVSPANLHQLVAGKALAGGFYCLVAGLVAVILTNHLFVHWGVTLVAVLLGSAFAVGLGLLVGVISDSPSTTGLWSGMVIVVLVALTILGYIGSIEWPALLQGIFRWQPVAVMINLFSISMTREISAASLWVNMAVLSAAAALVYILTLEYIRRKER